MSAPSPEQQPLETPSAAAPVPDYKDQAVRWIVSNEYLGYLGEERIRRICAAVEKIESSLDLEGRFNEGRWMTPAFRKEVLRVLTPDLRQISETHAWMVVRRYRELKRYFEEKTQLEEKRRQEEEKKAKLAAEKAAKAAAAKAAKEKAAAEATNASPAPEGKSVEKKTTPADSGSTSS